MRIAIHRWLRAARDRGFPRRAEADEQSRDRGGCEAIAFAEIVAAATVLEFGGLPLELPMSRRRVAGWGEGAD
jgi:hypothetical protein